MIAGKHIDRIILIAVAAAVLFCIGAMLLAPKLIDKYGTGIRMEYETRIFDTSEPVVINILMDPDEWDTMLDTATREVYHQCDVVIDGTKFQGVGIRPKGNTSLSNIAMNPDTDRYSFKLEFDQFVDGQTAWGLDKLCLNNNYADATNMKEALIYDMYEFIGADAPLYNYAAIYVNGEYWGVYLALEAVEDSFMLRNYGVTNGELYKPDSMGMGNFGDEDRDFFQRDPERDAEPTPTPEPTAAPDPMPPEGDLSESMREIVDAAGESGGASGESRRSRASGEPRGSGGGGGPFGGGGGQNLNYNGDDLSSYSTIWNSEVTKTDTADHRRVVQALKNISERVDLEESMDVDNLLRLMAVHNFSVNGDSLSGGMAHNYYLYESGGQLNVIPWDYNLSLGGMGMGGTDAKSVVNDAIDDTWQATDFFDPLLENEEYLAKYHEYYRQLVEGYIFGGLFDEFYERTREQIDDLVATDPNALYDYDEYDAAAETLYQLTKLRGESILGQLNGTIPATTSGQRADDSALIAADDIDLSIMGSMSMGGDFGGGGGFPDGENPFRSRRSSDEDSSGETASDGQAESASDEPKDAASDETAEAVSEAPASDERTEAASGEMSERAEDGVSGETAEEASGETDEDAPNEPDNASDESDASGETSDGQRRSSRRSGSSSGEMQRGVDAGTKRLLAACAVVLIAGIVFAAKFRKKG